MSQVNLTAIFYLWSTNWIKSMNSMLEKYLLKFIIIFLRAEPKSEERTEMIKRSWLSICLLILLLMMNSLALARTMPTWPGQSVIEFEVIKNIDEYDPHWGGNVGFCWRGRMDLRLDYRHDGFPGAKRLSLQGEVAFIKTKGFIFETGYHQELSAGKSGMFSGRRNNPVNLIPVRLSFPIKMGRYFHSIPNVTYWHVFQENIGAIGFVGIDFLIKKRYALGLELNVNQDFRFHDLDFRLGLYW